MESILLGYVVIFSFSAVVCLASIPRARSIQHPGTRQGLIGLLGSVSIWSAGYVGYFLAPTEPLKLASYLIGFVFAFIAVGVWLYFCAAYRVFLANEVWFHGSRSRSNPPTMAGGTVMSERMQGIV